MPAPKPFDILVLGPMALRQRGMVASEPRTRDLKRLIESIVADIQTERGADGPAFRVVAPAPPTSSSPASST